MDWKMYFRTVIVQSSVFRRRGAFGNTSRDRYDLSVISRHGPLTAAVMLAKSDPPCLECDDDDEYQNLSVVAAERRISCRPRRLRRATRPADGGR